MTQAWSYASQAVTNRFWVVDRICFALSPYITDDESWKIVQELEKMSKSRYEGNFTQQDAFDFIAQLIGPERYAAVTTLWAIENQNAIAAGNQPDMLREAWMHKITMQEGTETEVRNSPKDYVSILVPKSQYM